LRKKLVERTVETSTSQSRDGNANWLKKQFIEAQYMIIQLREEQRMLEEKTTEHFKECGPAMENVYIALVSAQTKLKGNKVMRR
jgi:hypothetical protein